MIKVEAQLKGLKGYQKALDGLIPVADKALGKALLKTVALIRYKTDTVKPLVPVRTGNMRSGFYSRPIQSAGSVGVEFGYTAWYAPLVHEMETRFGRTVNWTRKGSGQLWFITAIIRFQGHYIKGLQHQLVSDWEKYAQGLAKSKLKG